MIRILGLIALTGTIACGVAEAPYERPYYPQYRPGGDSTGGDPSGGGDTVVTTDCGNGQLDFGEQCDPGLALSDTCESLGYASGMLRCSTSCTLDTSSCQALETCNNGQLDTLEACEGYELRGETCQSQGFTAGTLRCSAACTLDTSQCTLCGNNILETGEECDGTQFGGRTCASERGTGWVGELSCNSCTSISTNYCTQAAGRDEQCYDGLACLEQYSCDVSYSSADGALATCKLRCSLPGSSSGCPSGEQCMETRWVELQNETPISCTTASNCDAGYDCVPTTDGDLCARFINWCGTQVNWVTDYSSTEAIQSGPVCNDIYGHALCRPATGSDPAETMCVPLGETGDGVCLTFCEGDEGDLDCGSGYQCAVPEANFYYMPEQGTDGGTISCSDDTPCGVDNGYACISLNSGQVCARPAKACLPL